MLAALREKGLVRHLGLSNVSAAQLREAQAIAPVVCVQNLYNVVERSDDELVDACAREGVGFTPFFPLGGFTPLQSGVLDDVAAQVGATPRQVALAWLLQRSPTMLLIPGTSSVAHLRENLAAVDVVLPPAAVARWTGSPPLTGPASSTRRWRITLSSGGSGFTRELRWRSMRPGNRNRRPHVPPGEDRGPVVVGAGRS